jgi:replicative DNA helicase
MSDKRSLSQSALDKARAFLHGNPQFTDLWPSDERAERGIVSAMMAEPRMISAILTTKGITRDYFFNPALQILAGTIVELLNVGTVPDFITIARRLEDAKQLEGIGGATFLHQLGNDVPHMSATEGYMRILIGKYARRRVIRDCLAYAASAWERQEDDQAFLADAQKVAVGWTAIGCRAEDATIHDQVAKLQEKRLESPATRLAGLSTPFEQLDGYTGGLCAGHLVVISGMGKKGKSRGSGKTTLATDLFRHVLLEHQSPAIFIQMEMFAEAMIYRMVSACAGIPLKHIIQKRLNDDQEKIVSDWLTWIAGTRAKLECNGRKTMAQVASKLRAFKALNPSAKVAIIDYFQLIELPGHREWSIAQISKEKSNQLKALAAELDLCVVVLSQLNKAGDTSEGVTLENDADAVLKIDHEGDTAIVIEKNRHGEDEFEGSAPRIQVVHDRECVRFLPYTAK